MSAHDAARIRRLLERLRLGQREAARMLHISDGAFRDMCAGRTRVPALVWERLEKLLTEKGGDVR